MHLSLLEWRGLCHMKLVMNLQAYGPTKQNTKMNRSSFQAHEGQKLDCNN